MRIAYLLHQFLPRHISGTEQLTFKVAEAMRRRGHEPFVVAAEPHTAREPRLRVEAEEVEGLAVHRVHGARARGPWFAADTGSPDVEAALAELLARERPDLVHVHHFSILGAGCLRAARHLRIPVIFTATDFWWTCPMSRLELADGSICAGPDRHAANCVAHLTGLALARRRPALARLAARMPRPAWSALTLAARLAGGAGPAPLAEIAALSQRARRLRDLVPAVATVLAPTIPVHDALLQAGFPESGIHLLPHSVEAHAAAATLPRAAGEPLEIGFIGSLLPHKGAHVLLDALAHIPVGHPVSLSVFGDPALDPRYSEALRQRAAGLPHPVQFRGTFPEARFGDILSQLDVVVLPSIWMENRPLTLLSALQARRPVIVSDMPGMTCEVTHGENGLVVPAGDAPALAAALTRLAADPDLGAALSAHPRRPPVLDDYVATLEEIYLATLARHRETAP